MFKDILENLLNNIGVKGMKKTIPKLGRPPPGRGGGSLKKCKSCEYPNTTAFEFQTYFSDLNKRREDT